MLPLSVQQIQTNANTSRENPIVSVAPIISNEDKLKQQLALRATKGALKALEAILDAGHFGLLGSLAFMTGRFTFSPTGGIVPKIATGLLTIFLAFRAGVVGREAVIKACQSSLDFHDCIKLIELLFQPELEQGILALEKPHITDMLPDS